MLTNCVDCGIKIAIPDGYTIQFDGKPRCSTCEFENTAKLFFEATGIMAPGKSIPAAMANSPLANEELRDLKFQAWFWEKMGWDN